jgi:hypothetical protein
MNVFFIASEVTSPCVIALRPLFDLPGELLERLAQSR